MSTTLGMMVSLAQPTPNTSVSLRRLIVAASRIEKTGSPSQPMHRLASWSSKKSTPSCLPRSGMYSMMACRTRHCLSSASWTMAGRSALDRSSIPITLLTTSSFEMMLSRTSGNSSLRSWRNSGRRCSIVASLPSCGARPEICDPRAARTCCDWSVDRSRMQGRRRARIVSRSVSSANPADERVTKESATSLSGARGEREREREGAHRGSGLLQPCGPRPPGP